MPIYLVERYIAQLDGPRAERLAEDSRRAASIMVAGGARIRYLRSTVVPEDETCFSLFESPSLEAVAEAHRRAGIDFQRINEAIELPDESPERGDASERSR